MYICYICVYIYTYFIYIYLHRYAYTYIHIYKTTSKEKETMNFEERNEGYEIYWEKKREGYNVTLVISKIQKICKERKYSILKTGSEF